MLHNFVYHQKRLEKREIANIKNLIGKESKKIWIYASNPSHKEMQALKECFNLHPTTIEDVLSHQTRIKYEEFDEYTLIVFRGANVNSKNKVSAYNLSFVLGENWAIAFSENGNDIINELLKHEGKIEHLLQKDEDSITHYIIDKEVDKYLEIKSELSDELRILEAEFMVTPNKSILAKIFSMELALLELGQLSESITDLCLRLIKPADNYIDNSLIPYFRDVYDHALRTTESFKKMLERINGMKNLHASIINIKTNEIMKVLTILMALMMPLTLITGFYGMNVPLPLQNHNYAWVFIIIFMIISGAFLVIISRKKGWMREDK